MRKLHFTKSRSLKAKKLLDYPVYLLIALIALIVTLATTPGTLLSDTKTFSSLNSIVSKIAPQGWSFFTKTSQDSTVIPFNSYGESLSLLPTSRLTNSFGANRKGRAQGIEIGILEQSVPTDAWVDCADTNCITKIQGETLKSVSNPVPRPSLCGDIYLLKSVPRPYAYRSLVRENHRLTSGVGLHVYCSGK